MNLFGEGAPGIAPWLFWASAFLIVYTYFLYPLLVALLARWRVCPVRRGEFQPDVTVVIAAHNEAARLSARVANLLWQDYPADRLKILVVSDGSTDDTSAVLDRLSAEHPGRVASLQLTERVGKSAALNRAMETVESELAVFADARQRFAPDAVARLAENFADPHVGSASGELMLESRDEGVAQQVGLYWRYEKWIRASESSFGSMLGATGAIYAIRRRLWQPLPQAALLDDFLTPMRIVLGGSRAIFDARATAWDRPSTHAGQEMRRKIRTLAGNFQAFSFEPGLLAPWRNPATWFQVWSHKLLRLLVPYALMTLALASLAAPGSFYGFMAVAQAFFYALAVAGWQSERHGRPIRLRLAALAWTFTALNLAAVAGLWAYLRGIDPNRLWSKSAPAGPH